MRRKVKKQLSPKAAMPAKEEIGTRLLNSGHLTGAYLGDRTLAEAVTTIRESRLFSERFYLDNYSGKDPLILMFDPISHYLSLGYKKGYRPSRDFDAKSYLRKHPDLETVGINPFLHYVLYGLQRDGGLKCLTANASTRTGSGSDGYSSDERHPDAKSIEHFFDVDFYVSGFSPDEQPADPVSHYLTKGWLEGRAPAAWFSGWHYLADHPDVKSAGMNPFLHYCLAGRYENRLIRQMNNDEAYAAQTYAVSAGPYFEEFDAEIGAGRRRRAKVLAYFLPQFHAIPLNDKHWGRGFTEWRNLPRGMPRFSGHLQPRIPRDLGCYDLSTGDAMHRQIEMAKAAGLYGFCYYYYWFDGERVLETPLERLLSDPTLDFPFCLMWANENWTRTWDGEEKEVIVQQTYRDEDEIPLVDDLARHMKDPRYIRIGSRPLLFIYRIGHLPNARDTVERIRAHFQKRHNLTPLIFQSQSFGDNDPRAFGADGAIEFPPHKILNYVPRVNDAVSILDPNFKGHVYRYESVVAAATSQESTDFPIIRTVFPSWDNDARRPGRSTIITHSTPTLFENWLDWAIGETASNPVYGERIVCINAWNEWAEGAYLEPDVHFGAAYLNAVARTVYGVRQKPRERILLVGHDAHKFGAQLLLLRIGEELVRQFGVEVTYLLPREGHSDGIKGDILDNYKAVGRVHIAAPEDPSLPSLLQDLTSSGYKAAITNTTATGFYVERLKEAGLRVVSLIHELPAIISEMGLTDHATAIARMSDKVIFPAQVVKSGFEAITGKTLDQASVRPQGLYNFDLLGMPVGDNGLRRKLGLPSDSKIVLGVGYGDLRKGIDRFITTALTVCSQDSKVFFVWVGRLRTDAVHWYEREIKSSGLENQIRLVGYDDDPARFFAAANVYYLSSREDPFPSVVLEALAMGLPVVGHAGCGGCDELISRHGTLVAAQDPQQAATTIRRALKQTPSANKKASEARQQEIAENYRFGSYVFDLMKYSRPGLASVSVVVPNYNYANYISERLWSVIDQDYPLWEVIVLDDASTDKSVAEVEKVIKVSPVPITLNVNTKNSGSVFRQWAKGVELSSGDYIWIAEADDGANPAFVREVVRRMQGSGSVLGFADSRQVDERGLSIGDSYKPYLNEIEEGAFDASFDMDGPEFIAHFLSVKNVILNVSGTVIRRDALIEALKTAGDSLFEYRVAGDWYLYTLLCSRPGSRVSYVHDSLNIHRRHSTSVTGRLKIKEHLQEISRMHTLASKLARLPRAIRAAQKKHILDCERFLKSRKS